MECSHLRLNWSKNAPLVLCHFFIPFIYEVMQNFRKTFRVDFYYKACNFLSPKWDYICSEVIKKFCLRGWVYTLPPLYTSTVNKQVF